MRIAYISLHWPRKKASGIGRKIEEQISAWRQAGHTVKFFAHRTFSANPDELVAGDSFEYRVRGGLTGRFKTEINRCLAVFPLLKAVNEFAPDLIYLRWGMYVFPSHKIFDIAPVVVEINTNDVSQHEMLGALYSAYNRMTRGIFLNCASGLVFVSKELSTSASFTSFHQPGIVIANGIDLASNLPVPAPNNIRPRVGFIGTPEMKWQGVDKLVRLAELCPELDVDVIGYDSINNNYQRPANLFLHGYLDKARSRQVLSGVDIGLGTLALHRKGMREASPLKTREYLAYGIPIVLPYTDTDLEELAIDTILRIPNEESNIEENWMKVQDFAFRMKGIRVNRESITRLIGSEYKETTRLEYFQNCNKGKNTGK